MTINRWLIATIVLCASVTACNRSPDGETPQTARRPQQAGPTNPIVTAGHLVGAQAAAITGDQRTVQAHVGAMHTDMMRSMRLADPARRIDREAARSAVRPLPGVQSAVWVDRTNLLVLVSGSQHRTMSNIDTICLALEPLGDTLGVVVNLQNVVATTSEEADTLARNCQLREGERATLQPKRRMDVLEPELRKVFREQQGEGK